MLKRWQLWHAVLPEGIRQVHLWTPGCHGSSSNMAGTRTIRCLFVRGSTSSLILEIAVWKVHWLCRERRKEPSFIFIYCMNGCLSRPKSTFVRKCLCHFLVTSFPYCFLEIYWYKDESKFLILFCFWTRFERSTNFQRDCLVSGHSIHLTMWLKNRLPDYKHYVVLYKLSFCRHFVRQISLQCLWL